MKSVIFNEQMIMELQETGTAVKLSKVEPQRPHSLGDVLRVRETWRIYLRKNQPFIQYKAGWDEVAISHERYEHLQFNKRRIVWRPSTQMPSWASRYTVQCTAVSVDQIEGVWHWRNEYALAQEKSHE